MHYEEHVVNGVLCWRSTPGGKWNQKSPGELTARLLKYEAGLKRISLNASGDLPAPVIAGEILAGREPGP